MTDHHKGENLLNTRQMLTISVPDTIYQECLKDLDAGNYGTLTRGDLENTSKRFTFSRENAHCFIFN